MKKIKPKTYAAMVKKEEDIKKNSLKLYSYFLCIGGKEPGGTGRIFQHRDLQLKEIKRCTGLDPKTVKVYLYELETNGLVFFKGGQHFKTINELDYMDENGNINKKELYNAKLKEAAEVWKQRKGVSYYRIERPKEYTPIPEITLEKLNKVFNFTELEMKIYVLCCAYRDIQSDFCNGKNKVLRYEDIKDVLEIKDTGGAGSRKIKKTLFLLSAIGLIKFQTGYYINLHGKKIECFDLEEVYYYVKYDESKWSEEDCIETKEVAERLSGITKDYYDFTEA